MLGSSMAFSILFPSGYSLEVSKLRQQLNEAHLAWATEWKARQADFRIENIRFAHDPGWNKRFFSLQAARDGGTLFWRATRTVVFFGGFSI
ncbi:MAG TPA: hypothetical protein VMU69_13190 [Bradyrhizobium sp.]|nr:hypothetical protein [Bradyrhizobium sp.]